MYGGIDLGEALAGHIPWRDEAKVRLGVMVAQATAERVEGVAEHLQRIGIIANLIGIVVAGNDKDAVYGVGYGGIAVEYTRAETLALAVEGDAAAVAAKVEIVHAQTLGHTRVPCLCLWSAMVGHIAGAYDGYRLAGIGSILCHNVEAENHQEEGKKVTFHSI